MDNIKTFGKIKENFVREIGSVINRCNKIVTLRPHIVNIYLTIEDFIINSPIEIDTDDIGQLEGCRGIFIPKEAEGPYKGIDKLDLFLENIKTESDFVESYFRALSSLQVLETPRYDKDALVNNWFLMYIESYGYPNTQLYQ